MIDNQTVTPETVLVTGGLGFIGSAVVRLLIERTEHRVVNVDKVGYASTTGAVASVVDDGRYRFVRCDLADGEATGQMVEEIRPDSIIHLAAETHVDRSIDGPQAFMDANIGGTFNLLQSARSLPGFRKFVHVSTDEVFGSLSPDGPRFDESTAYDPRSPYSASKAASDHLVRAWGETYELPVSITNCSNNYGPFQFPEKLIPLMIIKAVRGEAMPVYGSGLNVRDWLFVADHASALLTVLGGGEVGATYAIGGGNELTNLDVVTMVADAVTEAVGDGADRRSLIEHVTDRPGHDFRYAVDSSKIEAELGWAPTRDFQTGLVDTVSWYLANRQWWEPLLGAGSGGDRLGLGVSDLATTGGQR